MPKTPHPAPKPAAAKPAAAKPAAGKPAAGKPAAGKPAAPDRGIVARPNAFPWPPVLLVASIAGAFALQLFVPLPWVPSPIQELLTLFGLVLVGIALAIDITSVLTLRRAQTTFLPHRGTAHLVTSGPFSFSRNPIYLGNVILLFGLGLAFGNPWFWPLALVDGALTQRLAILREEQHLQAKFPAAFLAYKRKVRRWI
ncbi:MAG: isoprenylcysteine carboxylmethyltransferase family protein [Phyllobacteriaceae bacterium]|nr:isoprenylcysteine carboxylmethyltransferase family protein [Phyllobacteriaceae bacterium]